MWLIILTESLKEREAIGSLQKLPDYKDHFLPMYRKERLNGGKREVVFLPLITRIVFLKLEFPAFKRTENLMVHIRKSFNDKGYILLNEEVLVDGEKQMRQKNTRLRLMCVTDAEKSVEERIKDATVSDSDIDSLRLFVDQMNSTMTEYSVVDDNYELLSSVNDTVMFTEGPYKGFQGVVKQKTVKGNRSRYFYLRVANWTFCIPNARRGRYVVMKEATHGKKAKEVTAWTNADLLLERFQALSCCEGLTEQEAFTLADDSASLLRLLLSGLGNNRKIEDFVRETASNPKLCDTTPYQLLLLFLCGSKHPKATVGKGKDVVPTLTSREASALISLNRHYLSTHNSIDYVLTTHIPDITLRPFLTPYVGHDVRDAQRKPAPTVIRHKDFTEYIIKVNVGRGNYNAHIGVKDNVCFVNWGDFSRKCEESKSDEFIADLRKKGMPRLAALLESGQYPFYKDDKNHIHGFMLSDDFSSFNSLSLSFLRPLLAAAEESFRSSRLLPLRNLLRRSVLLHRDPVIDQLVPVNPDMEAILYDDKGNLRKSLEEVARLSDYVTRIDSALMESMQVNRINYAITLYHQLLASVSGYIETALETGAPTTFTHLNTICTAAYNAVQSGKSYLTTLDCPTPQEECVRTSLLRQFDEAMTRHSPTIAYLRHSPSYLRTGLPTCISHPLKINK